MSEKWTDVEVGLLKKYYPVGSYKICQEKGLKRSEASIKNKAAVLGIKVNKKWSDEDIKILKEYYPKGGYKLCQEKGLNKSKDIIKTNANMLGLYVEGVLWSDDEISILNKYYPIGGSELCQEKGLKRTESAIRRKAVMYFPEHIRNKLYDRNNHPNKWSTFELDILKKYYPEGGVKLCQEKGLNRTSSAISGKAYNLNIKVINKEGVIELKNNTWAGDELKVLNDYYPKEGANLCKEQGINRSNDAIAVKARNLKINILNTDGECAFKFSKWSDDEISILKKYYPIGGGKLCQEKGLNRSYKSILHKARTCRVTRKYIR